MFKISCILSYFIIKPQLTIIISESRSCCILSYFIIKPQLFCGGDFTAQVLYLILFHHQTTTESRSNQFIALLYLILFHHQTTTR